MARSKKKQGHSQERFGELLRSHRKAQLFARACSQSVMSSSRLYRSRTSLFRDVLVCGAHPCLRPHLRVGDGRDELFVRGNVKVDETAQHQEREGLHAQ